MELARCEFVVEYPPDYLRLEEMVQGELKTAAKHTGVKTSDRVRHNIVEAGAVASHALLNSVEWEVTEDAYELVAEIYSLEKQALWIEEGRAPGPVPVAPIIEWMLDKGITPREGETLEQAAFAIARHIAKTGYEGRHVFADAGDEMTSIAIEAVDRAAQRIGRRLA